MISCSYFNVVQPMSAYLLGKLLLSIHATQVCQCLDSWQASHLQLLITFIATLRERAGHGDCQRDEYLQVAFLRCCWP